ncbi:MAG: pantoate--beta-alanine ligase [Acidimicrobiia bacterium]
MKIVTSSEELILFTNSVKEKSTVGFVPTMGYLHDGHIQLIKESRHQCDLTIVSIYVNPTQFGPNEDFANYPRNEDRDSQLCEENGVDILFFPKDDDIYRSGKDEIVVSFPELSQKLCGKHRPGHFDGVTTVMTKLLSIIKPNKCFMGKKDGQQLILINKMVDDLFIPSEIIGVSTMRENSGLAMSSRNVYLSETEKDQAIKINKEIESLAQKIENNYRDVELEKELEIARERLESAGLLVQYFDLVDRDKLDHVDNLSIGKYMLCIAAICGTTRLIDNYFIDINGGVVEVDRGIRMVSK